MRFRSARFNPSLRAPTSYTRRMASEFWHGESTGADDDEVWSFAWEEAAAAGLSGRAADKHANAALRMVQAREKVRAMSRAAGMKPGAVHGRDSRGHAKKRPNPSRGHKNPSRGHKVPFDPRWAKYGVKASDPVSVWHVEDDHASLGPVKYEFHGWLGQTSDGRDYMVGSILHKGQWSDDYGMFVDMPGRRVSPMKTRSNPHYRSRRYKAYPFYVVRKSDGLVSSGWDYREDALHTLRHPGEYDDRTSKDDYKVLSHAGVKRVYGQVKWAK
jgi:hypothetical protein